jgi:hypothetical protein
MPGISPADHDAGGDAQHRGDKHLLQSAAHVAVLAHARDHHGRGHRDQQAGNLGHQRVTDGQQDVAVGRLARRQAVLGHADDEAADDVDHQNQDAGHGVAAHKLGGTVHGAEEVGFLAHFGAAALGFGFVDQAGVQVGVHGHLLAGHGVQGEAGRDFGNPLGTLGDHHEVDDHQDGEHDQTHGKVAADQEVAEGLDHRARRAGAGVAFHQHHAGGGHVQRQAHQRGQQQHRGEGRKVQRLDHVGRHHHHHQRHGDVEREEGVQQPGRNGQHHQRQNGNHQNRGRQALQRIAMLASHLLDVLDHCGAHGAVLSVVDSGAVRSLVCGSSSGGTGGCTSSPGAGLRRAARP